MAGNPNPQLITAPLWQLWQDFDAMESSALLGGIYAAKPGYHSYRNRLPRNDYSTGRDVAGDKRGPGDKACAIDLTMSAAAMVKYTKRLDAAARAKDPRLYIDGRPILREFIGTKDNKTVYCWVFTGGRALGVAGDSGPDPGRDTSHLWHLHLSIIREFITNATALHQITSLLRGEPKPSATKPTPAPPGKPATNPTVKEVDVESAKDLLDADVVPNRAWRADAKDNPTVRWEWAVVSTWDEAHAANTRANEANQKADRILALLQTLSGRDFTDENAIVAGVLAGLSPAAIATAVTQALPPDMARQVVNELVAKLQSV
jgi:hypothetical protein